MIFSNREQAARLLAEKLTAYKGRNPLILAIPRGAVPMARIIADALGGEFDVVLVRKLGAPGNPEFAIGAIDETGWAYLGPYAAMAGADDGYIERIKARELETLRQRRAQYSPLHPPIDPQGRIAIVVDDGLATGSTMLAALHALRQRMPQKLVCAVPVAPPDTLAKVAGMADEVVCLYAPENFQAVGQFYVDFGQVEDAEVIALLSERKKP
ncbi:MAG: phosphoribosyltransferase [Zoogloeaceae bacterium]|nr:phosphoribosyltransferase [Zoogloeaceae bacterium]MCK6384287.1 phosphoribosyltransferase [Rhodocyclaceae bacterium]